MKNENLPYTHESFNALMDKYLPLVHMTTFRMLRDSRESAAVTRDIFLGIWHGRISHDDRQDLEQWLLGLVCIRCSRILRRRWLKRLVRQQPPVFSSSLLHILSPEEEFLLRESWEIHCRAADRMTVNQVMVYVLHELCAVSAPTVRKLTGLGAEKVRNEMSMARRRVRTELERYRKQYVNVDYRKYVGMLRNVPSFPEDSGLQEDIFRRIQGYKADYKAVMMSFVRILLVAAGLLLLLMLYLGER